MKVSLDSLRTEMKMRNEATRREIEMNKNALREEMNPLRSIEKIITNCHNSLTQLVRQSKERSERSIQALADKFDGPVQIRERLATLQARIPKQ